MRLLLLVLVRATAARQAASRLVPWKSAGLRRYFATIMNPHKPLMEGGGEATAK